MRERIIGVLVANYLFDTVDVLTVAVLPEYTRMSVATRLFQHLFDLYPDATFFLEVAENNGPALALYQKLGFRELRIRKNYYVSADKKIMVNAVVIEREDKAR